MRIRRLRETPGSEAAGRFTKIRYSNVDDRGVKQDGKDRSWGGDKSIRADPRTATAGGGPPFNGDHFAGDIRGSMERAFLRAGGLSKEAVRRRPIIGICSSWWSPTPATWTPRPCGVGEEGSHCGRRIAVVFPTISLAENFIVPTTMLLRNLMAMDVEEMIRCSPMTEWSCCPVATRPCRPN